MCNDFVGEDEKWFFQLYPPADEDEEEGITDEPYLVFTCEQIIESSRTVACLAAVSTAMNKVKPESFEKPEKFSDDESDHRLPSGFYLVDTECAQYLITRDAVLGRIYQSKEAITFSTSAGLVDKRNIRARHTLMGGNLAAWELEDTPWALSIGTRCMQMGFSFIRVAKSVPIMIGPDGSRIEFSVHDNIPYFKVGQSAHLSVA